MNLSNKKLFVTTCAAVFAMAAHAASLPVGFSYGKIAESGLSKVGKATVSGAVVIPAEKLQKYAGATVTGVRVGLVTADGVNNLTGWIRSSLEGENLDHTVVESAVEGWNEISLDGGLTIDGSPLVAGFSFDQTSGVKCISVVGENNDNARWIAKNGTWELAKNRGVLSLELIISGNNVPAKDLEIIKISSCELPVKAGEDMDFDITVRNVALEAIDGFDFNYQVDVDEQMTLHNDVRLEYGDMANVKFTVPATAVTPDDVSCLTIKAVCADDEAPENNIDVLRIGSYSTSFPRRVLIEEFTTEECPNCPRAINTLKQCELAGYDEKMAVVAHHVGFYTDFLTVEEDKDYLWFFGQTGGFAPAVMLDRRVPESKDVPVQSIGYFDTFETTLKEAADYPAFVKVAPSLIESEDELLHITVNLEKMPILETCNMDTRLTVYLIEDSIPMLHQAGISSKTFKHSHVYRKCLTGLWGDRIQWSEPNHFGNHRADMSYEIDLDPTWKKENLSVVAFVHEHNEADIYKCRVFNTGIASYGESTGVDTEFAESIPVSEEFTTITGMKANSNTGGILIKTVRYQDGSVKTSKIIKR